MSAASQTAAPAIRVEGLRRSFTGQLALAGVSLIQVTTMIRRRLDLPLRRAPRPG